jgi:large subunit ribosomal protein L23
MEFWRRTKKNIGEEKILSTQKSSEEIARKSAVSMRNPESSLFGVLRRSRVTEKSSAETARHNVYIFDVAPRAKKPEIKKAVEGRWPVRVEKVRVLRTAGKERRRGRIVGWKPGIKKAMVTLMTGDRIDIQ